MVVGRGGRIARLTRSPLLSTSSLPRCATHTQIRKPSPLPAATGPSRIPGPAGWHPATRWAGVAGSLRYLFPCLRAATASSRIGWLWRDRGKRVQEKGRSGRHGLPQPRSVGGQALPLSLCARWVGGLASSLGVVPARLAARSSTATGPEGVAPPEERSQQQVKVTPSWNCATHGRK